MKELATGFRILALAAWTAALVGNAHGEIVRAFVSIPPQLEFVRKIGGDRVAVEVLLARGQSPHSFDPPPRTVARLGESRFFFRAGVPYEDRLAGRLTELFTGLEVVDTREGIELRDIGGGRDGEGDDPHTWLDPKLVKIQTQTICEALIRADRACAATYRANLASYHRELDSLSSEIGGLLAPYRGRSVYVHHPAFGYFLDAFGLGQEAVQLGGREPSARELAALVDKMRAERVRTLFVQPEFPSPVADALSMALDCKVVRIDPLAPDYMDNLRRMAALIAGALARQN